jgi:hypothetical protein
LYLIKFLFLITIVVSFNASLDAQINLKAGYLGVRGEFEKSNQIFDDFNQNNTLSKGFHDFHYLQGIDLGIRYKYNRVAIEVGWNNIQSSKIKALGTNIDENWRVSNSEAYLALENYFGNFGFGVSMGYNTIRYKRKISGTRDRATIDKGKYLSSKIYVLTTVSSGKTAISIKPFYQPKWGEIDISDFNMALNGTKPAGLIDYLSGFGISIALYNGAQ